MRFREFAYQGSLVITLVFGLAQYGLNLACRNPVPTFPQRSPPSLLTTAARGGSRSTPDADLEGSYSSATPCGPALLVTPCHNRTHVPQQEDGVLQAPCRRWRAASTAR